MKQRTRNRILIWLLWVVWILFTSSTVFGGSNNWGNWGELTNWLINNSVCIDYVTPSWLTWHSCSSVSVTYTGNQNTWGNEYVIQKSQKTWWMADYTQREINVESGEYILYKIEFASVTWSCTSATVQDALPKCVKYIDSSMAWVTWIPTFNSWLDYIEYKRFGLNGRNTWYLFITGQIITNTTSCSGRYEYINTWSFKCNSPSGRLISSSVVARRIQGWWTSWSVVTFEKTWNKYERHPAETWLKFTIRVENEWPNDISDVYVYDIWPGNNNCIEFDRWVWNQNAIEYLWDYKRHYKRWNWILRAWWHFEFDIYANISNNPSCTWSYINTWQLTYVESWKPHEKIDDYQFIVVDGWWWIKISIKKTVEPTVVTSWSEVTYTIKYTNEWDTILTDYTIQDNRPYQYLDFVSATPNINGSGSNRSTLSWRTPNLPSLEAWDSLEITVVWRVKAR